MQDGPSADRAADRDGLVQCKGIDHGQDRLDVGLRGQPVFDVLPAWRRRGLAMPGHVEGDDAKLSEDLAVIEDSAVLPAVGTGRVQAEERDAIACLLHIEAVRLAADRHVQKARYNGLEPGLAHWALPALGRGSASRSL